MPKLPGRARSTQSVPQYYPYYCHYYAERVESGDNGHVTLTQQGQVGRMCHLVTEEMEELEEKLRVIIHS